MDIKLIAVDLDGTLLNDENKVSVENLNAIKTLKEKGIVVAPCTGRGLSEIPSEVKNNENVRYVIYSNGAVVFDKDCNKATKLCICNKIFIKLLSILGKYQTYLTIRIDGKCYVKKGSLNDYNINYFHIIPTHVDVIKNYAIEIDDFDNWLKGLDGVEMISVFFHTHEEEDAFKKQLSQMQELMFVKACEFNAEIMNKDAGKGSGVRVLANILSLEKQKVACVGDSGNDLPMMQAAGVSIAVSNASPDLKAVCDKIICSNNEHAIDFILKNFIL